MKSLRLSLEKSTGIKFLKQKVIFPLIALIAIILSLFSVSSCSVPDSTSLPPRAATIVVCARNAQSTLHCDYKAVEGGPSDDVLIQSAINSLTAAGGTVLLSEGTFNIANTIIIDKKRVVLAGHGRIATMLDPVDGFGDEPVIAIRGQNESEVKDLAIIDEGFSSELTTGIDITSSTSAVLKNLWFGGLTKGTGIQIGSSDGAASGFLIQGIYIESCQNGILIERESRNGRLIGVQAYNCSIGLHIREVTGRSPQHLSISASSFPSNGIGVLVDGGRAISFSGIVCHNNETYGMRFGSTGKLTSDITVVGSIFSQNGLDTLASQWARSGVFIDRPTTRITFDGCSSFDSRAYRNRTQNYGYIIDGVDNRILNSNCLNN